MFEAWPSRCSSCSAFRPGRRQLPERRHPIACRSCWSATGARSAPSPEPNAVAAAGRTPRTRPLRSRVCRAPTCPGCGNRIAALHNIPVRELARCCAAAAPPAARDLAALSRSSKRCRRCFGARVAWHVRLGWQTVAARRASPGSLHRAHAASTSITSSCPTDHAAAALAGLC